MFFAFYSATPNPCLSLQLINEAGSAEFNTEVLLTCIFLQYSLTIYAISALFTCAFATTFVLRESRTFYPIRIGIRKAHKEIRSKWFILLLAETHSIFTFLAFEVTWGVARMQWRDHVPYYIRWHAIYHGDR